MKTGKPRLTLFDALIAVLIIGCVWYISYRIRIGLHYKWNWPVIAQYLFRYDSAEGRWMASLLVQGLLITLRLSIWGTISALIIGTVMGLCRISQSLFIRLLSRTYVELMRNIPPLVLVFIFYYFVSEQIVPAGIIESFLRNQSGAVLSAVEVLFSPPELLPEFLAAMFTLAVFEGAYITEIIRAGIQSVEKGQWEACFALGFARGQQMRYVILPQAVQRILPPLGSQFISTIKDSSIVSVISIQELTFQGMELMAATYLTFEIWITVTVLYLALTLSCSLAVQWMEHRFSRSG